MSDLQMQKDELLALPVSVDLTTAGRAFGLGRTRAYELARTGLTIRSRESGRSSGSPAVANA